MLLFPWAACLRVTILNDRLMNERKKKGSFISFQGKVIKIPPQACDWQEIPMDLAYYCRWSSTVAFKSQVQQQITASQQLLIYHHKVGGGGLWRFYGLWALDVTAVDYVTTNHPHAQSAALNPTLSRGAQLGSSSVGHKKSLISRPVA